MSHKLNYTLVEVDGKWMQNVAYEQQKPTLSSNFTLLIPCANYGGITFSKNLKARRDTNFGKLEENS